MYEKGAEVVRLYETLLGKAGFRHGMDTFFQRHDGEAVNPVKHENVNNHNKRLDPQ